MSVTSLDTRRRLWADFVRRATDQAKLARGWSIPKVAAEASIGPATIYRWLEQGWETAPKAELVERFCDALDIATQPAFSILWPGKQGVALAPEPMTTDPDVETIQRKLNNPSISEQEKHVLRENLRMLALRR